MNKRGGQKTIYLHGSFHSENYGDYLLCEIPAKELKNAFGDIELVTDQISDLYLRYADIERLKLPTCVHRCSLAVAVGGGYYGEKQRGDHRWYYRCFINHIVPFLLLKLFGKRYAIIGVGAGPISNKLLAACVRRVFNLADYVSVRDEESRLFLTQIGVKTNIEVNPDWVLSDSTLKLLDAQDNKDQPPKLLIHISKIWDSSALVEVCEAVNTFLAENKAIKCILITDNTNQKAALDYLQNKIKGDKIIRPYSNPLETLRTISECDYLITSKLHVGITGYRLKKKVLVIPLHQKIMRFYHQVNWDQYVVGSRDICRESFLEKMNHCFLLDNPVYNKDVYKAANNNVDRLLSYVVGRMEK